MTESQDRLKRAVLIALLASAASSFWFLENLTNPSPFRIGIANMFTLTALYTIGGRAAFLVSIIRILIGSTLTGKLLSPTFLISSSGGILSVLGMVTVKKLNRFSMIGVSITGAFLNNIAQLSTTYLLMGKPSGMLYLFGYLSIASIPAGAFVGWGSYLTTKRVLPLFRR
ncbi:Gx transporter family protein [bacterium]|nr:Gx transporter family protein [bacterium]